MYIIYICSGAITQLASVDRSAGVNLHYITTKRLTDHEHSVVFGQGSETLTYLDINTPGKQSFKLAIVRDLVRTHDPDILGLHESQLKEKDILENATVVKSNDGLDSTVLSKNQMHFKKHIALENPITYSGNYREQIYISCNHQVKFPKKGGGYIIGSVASIYSSSMLRPYKDHHH